MWAPDDDAAYCSDDAHEGGGAHAVVEDPEEWMDHYSDELLDLWYYLKERCESQGHAILDTCQFPDFAEFCFKCSSGYPPSV